MESRILYPSRLGLGSLLIVGILGCLLSLVLIRDNREIYQIVGYFLLICAVGWLVGCSINFLGSACYLKLTANNFTASFLFKSETFRWRDIEDFRTFRFQFRLLGLSLGGFLDHVVVDLHEDAVSCEVSHLGCSDPGTVA